MILDNLSRAFKTQNWLAAGVEFVIVITGVVIGFQITAWNEGREARGLEAEYVERLIADVESSIAFNAYLEEILDRHIGEAREVREALDTCAPVEPALFGNVMIRLGKNSPPALTRGVYDELISSGRQGLLRSPSLRAALAEAYDYVSLQEELFAAIGNGNEGPSEIIASQITLRVGAPFPYDTRHPADAFRFDYEALCSDPAFLNAVDRLMVQNFEAKSRYGRVAERIDALFHALLAARAGQ